MRAIKTNESWRRHMPGRPRRVSGVYSSKPKKSLSKKIVVRIIWFILFLLLVQSVFQIPYLRIEKVELLNNRDLTLDEVQNVVNGELDHPKWLVFKSSNYFLFDTVGLHDKLLSSFNLDQVRITKKFPDKLIIDVSEKISHFIWQKDDTYYLLDAEGAKNRQISGPDEKYIILWDQRSQMPAEDVIFTENEIDKINQIFIKWNQAINGRVKLLSIIIRDDAASWELQTDVGYTVKINAAEEIGTQIENLERILKAGNITGGDIDYIDVRFGDKVYFK